MEFAMKESDHALNKLVFGQDSNQEQGISFQLEVSDERSEFRLWTIIKKL
jgi:hypothetical protein